MQVSVHLPEDIARNLAQDAEGLERTILESLAAEGVRSGKLSRGQTRRLLGFETRDEVDGFLKARGIPVQQSLEEIQRDSELVLKLGQQ